MEEGLKNPDDLDTDLAIRSTYRDAAMDLEVAHRGIVGSEHHFDPDRAPRQPTWRVMADVMLRREHPATTPTDADRRRYRALRLGRSDGDSLLTELLPYPHPKTSDWLYARFERYPSRDAYMHAMLPMRLQLLRGMLVEGRRELIVCYGKHNWPHYQNLLDGVSWVDIGPYRVGEMARTRVVLTTHFSGRGFNTDAQLATLAGVAL